jgi:hypothetical protein
VQQGQLAAASANALPAPSTTHKTTGNKWRSTSALPLIRLVASSLCVCCQQTCHMLCHVVVKQPSAVLLGGCSRGSLRPPQRMHCRRHPPLTRQPTTCGAAPVLYPQSGSGMSKSALWHLKQHIWYFVVPGVLDLFGVYITHFHYWFMPCAAVYMLCREHNAKLLLSCTIGCSCCRNKGLLCCPPSRWRNYPQAPSMAQGLEQPAPVWILYFSYWKAHASSASR